MVGQLVAAKYQVLELIAQGGMGKIYRTEQVPLGRIVALKFLNPRYASTQSDPEFQKRFFLEAATTARLTHPNTVTVFDYGKVESPDGEDGFYIAMEFIEGRTLAQILRREGAFAPSRAIAITRQIARALRAAHRLGIVHRDLKPSNVMLTDSDEGESVKVLDFGIAKVLDDDSEELTLEGRFVGSPRYMAPEQIRHNEIDGRADIYALGVLLFEMLSGKVPFEGQQAVQTLMAHLSDPVPSIAERSGTFVAPELEALVRKCLEKNRDARYADVDQFLLALNEIAPGLGDSTMVGRGTFPPGTTVDNVDTAQVQAPSTPQVMVEGHSDAARQAGAETTSTVPPVLAAAPSIRRNSSPTSARPASPGSVRPSKRPGARKLKRERALLFVAAAVVAAILLAWWTIPTPGREGAEIPEVPRAGVAPRQIEVPDPRPAPTLPEAPTANPSPAAQRAPTLRIESTPEGAEVWEGATMLGVTPLTLPLDAAALAAAPRRFEVRQLGFRPETILQGPTETDVVAEARLRPIAADTLPRPRPRPRPAPSGPTAQEPPRNNDIRLER